MSRGAGNQSVDWGTTAGRHGRSQRDRQAEQSAHTGVRTATGSFFIAVSAFAETPPVLTARDDKHETQCALGIPLPRCAGSWTERAK